MANAEPVSVVMIGCGNFSRRYHVPTLEADPGVAFAGIFDPSPGDERASPVGAGGRATRRRTGGAAGDGRQDDGHRHDAARTPRRSRGLRPAAQLARAVRQALRPADERGTRAGRGSRAPPARQRGCLQPPLRPGLPAGARHHPRGRYRRRALHRRRCSSATKARDGFSCPRWAAADRLRGGARTWPTSCPGCSADNRPRCGRACGVAATPEPTAAASSRSCSTISNAT